MSEHEDSIIRVGMCVDCKNYLFYDSTGYCNAAAVWQEPIFLATSNRTLSIKAIDAREDPSKCGARGWFFEAKEE